MPNAPMEACGPLWVRQRTIVGTNRRPMKTTRDLMQRLKLEACLEGHAGCVNCLEWNQAGTLLASGSDDSNVSIWDPFRRQRRNLVTPGHEGIIFSVKFIPASSDALIASCAGDCQVRVTHALDNKNLLVCKSCHIDRVKRLAVHPSEPSLIWSAGEDGLILQFDTRQAHVCSVSKPTNILIDLDTINSCLEAKCIAVNPLRSEMLAVGSNDIYNRLFDRRYLKPGAWNSCTAYFAPGHLLKTNNRSNHIQSYGTTYLSFNSDGSELLASVHAEQVYLFHTYEPWERYQSFGSSLKPLLLDKAERKTYNPLELKSYSQLNHLRQKQQQTNVACSELPQDLMNPALSDDQWCEMYYKKSSDTPNNMVNYCNELLERVSNYPEIYRARAIALVHRDWRGDLYQALRDCSCALALRPLDTKTIRCLAMIFIKMADRRAACDLLEVVDLLLLDASNNQEELLQTKKSLLTYKRSPSPDNGSNIGERKISGMSANSIRSFILNQYSDLQNDLFSGETDQARLEYKRCAKSFDYSKRFCGHCNMNTDIKEANFFGANDEFIVGGSDDGAFYIWDKSTTNIVKAVHADYQVLNCVQPHPDICMLATSGVESSVKLWSSSGKLCRDVEALETRCTQNQKYISTDPLETMINMLYPPGS